MKTMGGQSGLGLGPGARALRQIKQWIAEGVLSPGDRLPAEESLASQLEVARTTIRRVIRDLERQGLIVVQGRQRTIAAGPDQRVSTLGQTVAMLTGPIAPIARSRLAPGWSRHIYLGVAEGVHEAGLHLLELAPDRLDSEAIERLAKERIRGLVVFRHATRDVTTAKLINSLRAAHLPIVVYGYEADVEAQDTVASDHALGSYQITKLLIERGCRRILRLWVKPNVADRPAWLAQRDLGYERAMREAGLEPLAPEGFSPPPGQEGKELFELHSRLAAGYLADYIVRGERIEGICTLSDGHAYAAAAACRRLGMIPGKDVLIAGYDNYWREAPEREYEPAGPVATVDKHNYEIGQLLVKTLLSVPDQGPHIPQHQMVEPELVVVSDAALAKA